jgi:hypothetical protein
MTDGGYQRGRYAQRAFNRVAKALAGTLEPDEALESAFFAHRYVPGLSLLFFFGSIGDIIYVIVARPYYAALTNKRFFLLKGGRWGFVSGVRDPEFTSPADSVRIEAGRKFLIRLTATVRVLTGEEVKLAVHRQYWKELDHMRSLLSRAG